MAKQLSLPYIFLFLLLVTGVYFFVRQPTILMDELRSSLKSHDEARWQDLIDNAQVPEYSKILMQSLLKMKYHFDWNAGQREDAMKTYYDGVEQLDDLSHQFASTKSFPHFICGELVNFSQRLNNDNGCWQLDGILQWMSPTRVKVLFENPGNGLQSTMTLQRIGLLDWQVEKVDLPVEKIFQQYRKRLEDGV